MVEFWNIGDVVLATPFLAALRERFPGASITLLGQPHAAEILADSDLVDEVIECSQRIERDGLEAYARASERPLEEVFETLLTGLAVRYYKAVAG